MTEILLENEQDFLPLTDDLENLLKTVCDKALELENCDFDAEISITLTDNKTIHQINSEHRGIDRPTDVLSFPMLEFDTEGICNSSEFEYDGDFVMLGDIVISIEQAITQAREFGHSVTREIAFLTAHSMLHLLGYDHELSDEDDKVMRQKQNDILDKLNIKRG